MGADCVTKGQTLSTFGPTTIPTAIPATARALQAARPAGSPAVAGMADEIALCDFKAM
jgi:hypothetical protein